MISEIRRDIQNRLDQLLSETDKLRKALTALGGSDGATETSSSTRRSSSRASSKSRSSSTRRRSTSTPKRTTSSRGAAGSTKGAVLSALSAGEAMTAADVAKATGLGRASVSTTLSRLAKSGEVTKADRGYRLPEGASATKA
jgi:CRP-like cAMP-binding protein